VLVTVAFSMVGVVGWLLPQARQHERAPAANRVVGIVLAVASLVSLMRFG